MPVVRRLTSLAGDGFQRPAARKLVEAELVGSERRKEEKEMGKRLLYRTFVFSRTITCEDVVGICHLMGLDPCSSDSRQLRPLMQTFATGTVWAALANLAGFNAIPVSSALEYAAPVEIGDTITAIAEAEERTRKGSLKVHLCFQNHRGELVAEGWALMGQNLDHSSPVSSNLEGSVG